jgi:Integrase core domain
MLRSASFWTANAIFWTSSGFFSSVRSLARFTLGIRRSVISSHAPRSPWQNEYVESLIGTIRRECLDHMIVFGEAHLRRILGKYAAYYNEARILGETPSQKTPDTEMGGVFCPLRFPTTSARGHLEKSQLR